MSRSSVPGSRRGPPSDRLPSLSLSPPSAPRGVVVESDYVHDEVRELASRAKSVIERHLQKHATSEAQVLEGVRRFGPSPSSRRILSREHEAAALAQRSGIYGVWRCATPKLRGANTDFCARVGPAHTCLCGHALSAHAPLAPARGRVPAPRCAAGGCGCNAFRYVPNDPTEVGEGWLARRPSWDGAWAPKCRCGHAPRQHRGAAPSACGECGCAGFAGHFLCVVCDRDGDAHETVFELEETRRRDGRPVREAFLPLAGFDWALRAAVLENPSGAPTDGSGEENGGKDAPPLPPLLKGREGEGERETTPEYCQACATIFRSAQSRFCSKCGKAR